MEIKKIWQTKSGEKLLTIPRRSDLKAGDYVLIKKIEEEVKH